MEKIKHLVDKFVPENYGIFLNINRKEKTFTGSVKIKGNALEKNIALHQNDLDVSSVVSSSKKLVFSVDKENEIVNIELEENGQVELEVKFSGHITDNMTGMYPSYYTINGIKKEVISTQFESHFARQVFPCIDEPKAKATFDLALKFDQVEGDIALSNMPEVEVENRIKTGVWKFKTTPKMSSYLLAFAVGELQSTIAKTKNGTEVGVFSTINHKLETMDFALDMAVKAIEFYEDYFGVKYPLPQSYHVALPDFSAGAMENWGLVTYREIYLLVDKNSTVSSRQQVALVIAHEVAHQWFGNLVTMNWWDDLWLNESFANMMEYVAIDHIKPDWNILEDFQTGGVLSALKRDATDGVQSVHVEVNHPDEINTLFDPAIVYAKGSRLMHMLRKWLGDESFSKGLGKYFEKHQYSNTVGHDLWDALTKVSDRDVASFMDSWLEQPGYPYITVKVEDDNLILSQKQFFVGKHEDKERLWHVPLNCNWEGLPEILSKREIVIPNYSGLKEKNRDALRLNIGNTAHYIVNYKGELFTNILLELNSLDNISKLQFIQDLCLLAENGLVLFDKVVELLPLLTNETSYTVTSAISTVISNLKLFVKKESEEEVKFKSIVEKVFLSNYNRLGIYAKENEKDEDEMVRQITLSSLLYSENEDLSSKLSKVFVEYKDNLEDIPAAIRLIVLANEIKKNESKELVNKYIELYSTTKDFNFKHNISQALSITKSENTVNTVLSVLKNKDIVKPQDLISWYRVFLMNDFSENSFWKWARDNWDWIKKTLGGDMSFDKFVVLPAAYFKTQKRLDEYKEFFEPQLSDMALRRNILMGINQIEARVNLINSQKEIVTNAILSVEI